MVTERPAPGEGWRERLARVRPALRALAGVPRVMRLVWDAHPGLALVLSALNLVQGLVPVSQAWVSKLVIDLVTAASFGLDVTRTEVLWLVALGAGIALVSSCVEPASTLVQVQLGDYLKKEIQTRILVKVNSLADISYFENPEFYDKLQRAHNDSGYRPLNVMHGVVQIFRSLVQLVSMVTVLLVFQPMLVLVAVAMAVPSLVQQLKSQVQMWEITSWSVPEVRRMRYFAELISGKDSAKEVRLYGLGNYFLDRFQREFDAFHSRFRALRQRHCRWEMGTALVGELGSSAMFFWLVLQALARRVTLGDLSLYSQAVWQTNGLIGGLVRQLSSLYAEILFVGQLFEFLETPPAMLTAPAESAHRAPQPLQAGIALRDVTFRYPGSDRPVLEKLNLSIAPGESVALVGENGAGKTTIVKLLTRLYDPDEGQILVDGVDLKDHDLDDWRRQTAAIFQDFCKYHLSARENIGLGDLRRLNEQSAILHAAARGGAGSVVEKLPDGYETILGRWLFHSNSDRVDEGSELSGGEWQKVALSRGFMRSDGAPGPDGHGGAQLLMLDEPTAALDTQSEYDVYLRFSELTRGKATLLISHRFSTVKMADRIVVLEHGRIIEEGTHTELVSLGGVYADLYEKQASRYR